jgi:NAD(P)-dependent dehydrogenase (short-subunit alcohol dehydrogenase family)
MLKGKVAVVTGAGTGIGAAIVRLFAQQGCRVVLAGRRREPLEAIAREVDGIAVSTDVRSEAQVVRLFQACDRGFGRLDILVNNAGTGGPTVPIEAEDMTAWDDTFAVNVRGVALCIKHAVPLLKRQGGAIVNIASDAVLRPKAQRAAYAASKCAVVGLTQVVAQELGPVNIRVNTVVPGATRTEMLMEIFKARALQHGLSEEAVMQQAVQGTALGRIAEPEDIAAAALFLAADASRAITGTVLVADAGRR